MKPYLTACVLFAATCAALPPGSAEAFRKDPGPSGVCSECHKFSKEEAAKVLGSMFDNIVGVVEGPFPGIWEVDVARDGKTYPIYMDYSLKYLFNGQFVRLSDWTNLTGARFSELNRVDVASIDTRSAIRVGAAAAKKKVIVLSDPTCPFCVKLHGEIQKAVAKDADVAFLVMPYPRNPNDRATYAKCLAVVCSKSPKLLDDVYAGKEPPAATCKSDAVDETMRLADRLRIPGTPTMILPDGRMISGSMEADRILGMLR